VSRPEGQKNEGFALSLIRKRQRANERIYKTPKSQDKEERIKKEEQ
jgi:hypothetical protein